MNIYILPIVSLLSLNLLGQVTSQPNVNNEDLKGLLGDWEGTLTYMDYRSGEPYSMPAQLTIESGKDGNQYVLFYSYPKEPNANSKGKIIVSKDGKQLNKKPVKSVITLANGSLQVITASKGKDNNKKALIKNIYVLGENELVIQKDVQFENSNEWIQRNRYRFERPSGM